MEPKVVTQPIGGAVPSKAALAVDVRALRVSYGGTRAVDGVDLTVRRGETFGLLVPNGAGKTTTLSVLQGLKAPEAGSQVSILGLNIATDAAQIRHRIGVSLQTTALFERLTLIELPRLDGIAATAQLLQRFPAMRVVLLTTFAYDRYILDSIRAGARGYLLKSSPASELV